MMNVDGGKDYAGWLISAAGLVTAGIGAANPVGACIAVGALAYSHYNLIKDERPTNRHRR